ncbi:hypothetical protein A8A54_19190 [Brucella pseudogrignonensis]|uniref:FUSC family protein n=1 Tax=Brucella pseudogrignonensis TaxID=419475 RepID=UPI0007DAB3D7|nr:FUSC family protein [Brucella pseudogrignonensis]ANG98733.1 hypothetical protein A8A54_19190 [Brucella pseudogrignonensis]
MPPRVIINFTNVLFSLKTFAAAMLAYFIAVSFDLPKPFWAVGTVYIIAHPLSGAITSKAIYRLLGTAIGGVMTVIIVPNLVNAPTLLTAAVVVWVGFCLFLSLLDRTPRSYVFLLAGYTVLLAGLPLVDSPEAVFDTVIARVEEIGIAIICAAVVSRVILPNHAGPVLLGRVDTWLTNAAKLSTDTLTGKLDESKVASEWRRLAADAVDMQAFTTHVSYDTSHHREFTALMRGLQQRKLALLPVVSSLADIRAALEQIKTPLANDAIELIENTGYWLNDQSDDARAVRFSLRDKAHCLFFSDANQPTWEHIILANAGQQICELIDIWQACQALRVDIALEHISPTSKQIIVEAGRSEQHVDYGMAFLTALSTMICISSATAFWILSGWTDGVTVAQISGVFCCLLATMDDPVPAMRKFLPLLLWAAVAAFVYNFAIMPMVDGFVPLVAALGLFLIPAGICLAVPSLFLIGMGLCVNFPFMIGLQARLNTDFAFFLNANIATVLAVIWAMVISGIVKSVGAETSGRRLIQAGWRQVYQLAAHERANLDRIRRRIIDILGLLAPRVAAAPQYGLIASDLIRDLRAGISLARLRSLHGKGQLDELFPNAACYYKLKADGEEAVPTALVENIDTCLASFAGNNVGPEQNETLKLLAALRIAISPQSPPPIFPPHPFGIPVSG